MIGSGRVALTRAVHFLRASKATNITTVRNSGHSVQYRMGPALPPQLSSRMAEALGALGWWWILWHVYTEPGHILGEFDYPDPSKWSDQELGITDD